jgi:hypothetical protein
MTIVLNPGPIDAAADLEKLGRWQYIIGRQIGPYWVSWQWIRIKHSFATGKYQDIYLDPKNGNRIFHTEDSDYGSGW